MENRNLRIASDILFKIFWIGLGFYLLSLLLFLPFKAHWYELLTTIWQSSNTEMLDIIAMSAFALVKVTLFFYILIPALAIRWSLCQIDKKR